MTVKLPISPRQLPGLSAGPLKRRRIYLDHACLTPTPESVANAVASYYRLPPGCPLRSNSGASNELELRIREGRDQIREWLNARFSDEIVFTANTTMAINLLASAFRRVPGAVLITDLEHNSNRLPWLDQDWVEVAWPPGTEFPLDEFRRAIRSRPIKLVSITGMSNVTGQAVPLRDVVRDAHALEIPVHVDAAQMAIHQIIDIGEDDPDLVSLSLHKAYGPSGLGVLYVRRRLQDVIHPLMGGGGSVDDHRDRTVQPAASPARFEFGLQNYAAQYAAPETVTFLRRFGREALDGHFRRLATRAATLLQDLPGIRFIDGGPGSRPSRSVVNFYLEGVDSMRVAELLDLAGAVQVRAGRMCAHHYYHRYALPPSIRISFGYHNTEEEVDRCVDTLRAVIQRYL